MPKTKLFIICCALFLGSCRTLQMQDFHQQNKLSEPLPPLALQVHAEGFAGHFAAEMLKEGMTYGAISDEPWFAIYTQLGEPMRDVFSLLGNELYDNTIQQTGESYGKARFRLAYYDRREPGWGWRIPSLMTLGTANLFGMPANKIQANLELQMEILDAGNNIVARYSAPGSGKATVAMYHGYNGFDARRKANLLALQEAMRGIRQKMETDLPKINADLQTAGTVKNPLKE